MQPCAGGQQAAPPWQHWAGLQPCLAPYGATHTCTNSSLGESRVFVGAWQLARAAVHRVFERQRLALGAWPRSSDRLRGITPQEQPKRVRWRRARTILAQYAKKGSQPTCTGKRRYGVEVLCGEITTLQGPRVAILVECGRTNTLTTILERNGAVNGVCVYHLQISSK
jgi:hypothetical protein